MPSTREEQEARKAPQAAAPAQPSEPVEKAIIIAEGLSKHFTQAGEVIKAVDQVNLRIAPRQLITFSGPSGCGKTTLMYLLGSLEKPTSGKLLIDGIDVGALRGRAEDDFRRQKVGFVFQSFNLIPNLSALENVMLPMEIAGGPRG